MSFIPAPTIAGDEDFFLDLLHALRDGLAADTALAAWCVTNAGRSHTVFVGIDLQNPPTEEMYPIVHLYPLREASGDPEHWVVGCLAGLFDPAAATVLSELVQELQVVAHLPVFAKLVQAALNTATPVALQLVAVAAEYETIEHFPFQLVVMELTFARPAEFRQRFA